MLYYEKLRDTREENNLKIYDISKILNIDDDVFGQYEREYVIIPIKHLNTVCNYLNVSLDYIFSFSTVRNYNNSRDDIDMILSGKRLKEIRKENNLTQDGLAKVLKTAKTTISGYERGARIIATPFLYDISKKYNISADYLLGKIDEPKYLKRTIENKSQ